MSGEAEAGEWECGCARGRAAGARDLMRAGLRGRGPEGILGSECSATVTGLSALSDQEAQEPGHSPRHVPV